MIKVLNILNGDASISIMKEAGIEGDFLPWRDFLHEGPVPANLSLEELSKVRAKFIADCGLGKLKTIEKEFIKRDKKLNTYHTYEKVVLWFEHDLYDQLQLLQLLAWFSTQNVRLTELSLICTNKYLGESSATQIKKLSQYESTISKEHLALGAKAWAAFCDSTPLKWAKLLEDSTALLPFLNAAVYRMLEEYPNKKCGLSRTAYQTLMVIAQGMKKRSEIFLDTQNLEERKFMGDVIFWKILDDLEYYAVIKNKEDSCLITPLGKSLLRGEKNWLNITTTQRSIGGVTLNPNNLWCWDAKEKKIEHYYYSKSLESLLKVK